MQLQTCSLKMDYNKVYQVYYSSSVWNKWDPWKLPRIPAPNPELFWQNWCPSDGSPHKWLYGPALMPLYQVLFEIILGISPSTAAPYFMSREKFMSLPPTSWFKSHLPLPHYLPIKKKLSHPALVYFQRLTTFGPWNRLNTNPHTLPYFWSTTLCLKPQFF